MLLYLYIIDNIFYRSIQKKKQQEYDFLKIHKKYCREIDCIYIEELVIVYIIQYLINTVYESNKKGILINASFYYFSIIRPFCTARTKEVL